MRVTTTPRLACSRRALLAGLAAASCPLSGCGRGERAGAGLVVGFIPNLTHAQALVAAHEGTWARALGPGSSLVPFPGGPAVMEALTAGSLDAAFLGPSAVIGAFVRSRGKRLRVVSGAASGGASLVAVRGRGIAHPRDLAGRTVTASQIGSTPDVSLRSALAAHGLAPADRGGTVRVIPMPNAEAFGLLKRRQLDAVWAQEPWASRMVVEAGAERVLDERDLWEGGAFPSALLVAGARALADRRALVAKLAALVADDTERMAREPLEARERTGAALAKMLGKPLPDGVLAEAWSRMSLTTDPMPRALEKMAASMRAIGYLPDGSLAGLVEGPRQAQVGVTP